MVLGPNVSAAAVAKPRRAQAAAASKQPYFLAR